MGAPVSFAGTAQVGAGHRRLPRHHRRAEGFQLHRKICRGHHRLRTDRRRRHDHAVELAAQPDRAEGRTGARRGQHDGAQALRRMPRQRDDLRRNPRRRGRAPGRVQPRAGRWSRPSATRSAPTPASKWSASPARPAPGSSSPRRRPTPSSASIRNSAASRRTSSCPTPISPRCCHRRCRACWSTPARAASPRRASWFRRSVRPKRSASSRRCSTARRSATR